MRIQLHQSTLFPPPATPTKLYTLVWNGQTIVAKAHYAVCNGKKTELIGKGWSKSLFEIKRAK